MKHTEAQILRCISLMAVLISSQAYAQEATTAQQEISAKPVVEGEAASFDNQKVIDTPDDTVASKEPPHAAVQAGVSAKTEVKTTEQKSATEPPLGSVSDGARISVDDKGFSLTVPEGWIIRRDLPRTSLYLQAPNKADGGYLRNIGVAKFTGPKVINDITADEFAKYLEKNFPASSPEITNYQLRNHQMVQMADGREGILFYTDFKANDRAMMQAHVLVSSETHHYLITYTDLADHFENPTGNTGYLAEAWESMISIELNSPNPKPLEDAQNNLLYVGIAIVIGVAFMVWRNRSAGRLYSDYGAMEPGEAAELDPKTNALEDDSISTNTNMSYFKGAEQENVVPFKKKKKTKADSAPVSDLAVGESLPATDVEGDEDLPRDQWKVS